MNLPVYLGLGLLGCLLGGPFMDGVHVQRCPGRWMHDEGFRYCYLPQRLNWSDAWIECDRLGMSLAPMSCYHVSEKVGKYLNRLGVQTDVWIRPSTFMEPDYAQPLHDSLRLVRNSALRRLHHWEDVRRGDVPWAGHKSGTREVDDSFSVFFIFYVFHMNVFLVAVERKQSLPWGHLPTGHR